MAMGALTARRAFTSVTWAGVLRVEDRRPVGTSGGIPPGPSQRGCIDLEPARRW